MHNSYRRIKSDKVNNLIEFNYHIIIHFLKNNNGHISVYLTIDNYVDQNNNHDSKYWYNIIFIILINIIVNSLVCIAIVIYSIMHNSYWRIKSNNVSNIIEISYHIAVHFLKNNNGHISVYLTIDNYVDQNNNYDS